jgi:AcrR family transcriptional regulator
MQYDSLHRPNRERSDAMRRRLLAAGRDLFVEKGFAETGTPELVARAGVTRGALYHHFTDKAALFRAVVEAEAEAVAEEVASVSAGAQALEDGTRVWLEAMSRLGRVRLILIDGPAVLGPEVMRAIDLATGGAELRAGLADALALPSGPDLDALADVLSAGFDRAALAMASGQAAGPYVAALSRLISALAKD